MGVLEKAVPHQVTKCPTSVDIDSENLRNGVKSQTSLSPDRVISLDHGDPTMFESYWKKTGDEATVTFSGSDLLSYFSDVRNFCWFLEPDLAKAIKKLHQVVGNAVVEDRYIVVGTGSTQLIQAALYALCSPENPKPTNVISAAPYYSAYPELTNYLRSGLYKWAGDAYKFNEDGPFIELINSPNNPDGAAKDAVVANRGTEGKQVHDFAYYWPHYAPITAPADYEIMLFTFSKCTGHAGSRIGWAVVKDEEVAKKMVKFIEINSIGVSKESQIRAAKILGIIANSCQEYDVPERENFFQYSHNLMMERWAKLKEIVEGKQGIFSLPNYPKSYCLFFKKFTEPYPAFAWMMREADDISDTQQVFKENKLLTRSGIRFGVDAKYVRISMVSRDEEFHIFLERLKAMINKKVTTTCNGNHS